MNARERTVCRIELPIGHGRGTGFLIAPDRGDDQHHVIESLIDPSIEGRYAWTDLRQAGDAGTPLTEATA